MLTLLFVLTLQTPFDYDASQPLRVEVGSRETRGKALVQQLSYASPKGGRVPAILVTPNGPPLEEAAIIFMHWGLGNRFAFLDEALTLAGSGVTSLLIDAPFNRSDAPKGNEAGEIVQSVVDLRRAVDFLQERSAVKHRIGFVGLSYGSWTGGILSGVEPRIEAFVLAGGLASNSEAQRDASLAAFDAEKWVSKAKVPLFLQFAIKDEYISREQARRYDEAAAQPHILKWYEGGHEFNAAARRDRISWLGTIFGFSPADAAYQPIDMPEKPIAFFGPYAEIAKGGVVIDIPGMQHIPVKRDIAWKEGLRFDAYYPHGVRPTERIPAIIVLAGQAPPDFMRAMRAMRFSTTLARALAARSNRVVIMPDLRTSHTQTERYANLPSVAQDVDDLIAYVRSHADELQIDRESLGLVFRSAGWSYGFRAAYRNAPPYVKAVVAHYVSLSTETLGKTRLSAPFINEINPPAVVTQGKAPLLLITAQHDFFYKPDETKRFLDAAATANVAVKHIHLPNSGHAFDIDNDLEESRDALLQTMLFLRENLPIKRPAP